MDSIDTPLAQWRAKGLSLRPGIAAPYIEAKLTAIGRETSSEVLRLFGAVDGMGPGESDDHLFSLWSIDQAIKESNAFDAQYLPFADFLISSCTFLLRHESADQSSVWIRYERDDVTRRVAASVKEFFDVLVNEPARLEIVP